MRPARTASEKLRFAAWIRVSTDRQLENKSLQGQENNIRTAIDLMGAQLTHVYKGQEHATVGWEKKRLEQLVRDARSKRFDAVMVQDPSRWSRDIEGSERAMRELRESGIRFFALMQEFDLHDANAMHGLRNLTVSNQYQADLQKQRFQMGRYEWAKDGANAIGGRPPYGWRYKPHDGRRGGQFCEDPETAATLRRVAGAYLKQGGSWLTVSERFGGLPETWRRRVLSMAARGVWRNNIIVMGQKRVVEHRIAPILSEDIVAAVKEKSSSNRENRNCDHSYALDNSLRCGLCGSVLSVHTQGSGAYVQHHKRTGKRTTECPSGFGRFDRIELAVLATLSESFLRTQRLTAAVRDALYSELTGLEETKVRVSQLSDELARVDREEQSLIDLEVRAASAGNASAGDKVQAALNRLQKRRVEIDADLRVAQLSLDSMTEPLDLNQRVQGVVARFGRSKSKGFEIWHWPVECQREFVIALFGGKSLKTDQSMRRGVFLWVREARVPGNPVIDWELRGLLRPLHGAVGSATDSPSSEASDDAFDHNAIREIIAGTTFNAAEHAVIPAKWSSRRWPTTPQRSFSRTTTRRAWQSPAGPTSC